MDFVWRRPVRMISRTRQVFISNVIIFNELKQFKRNKATAIDGLPPGMLKIVGNIFLVLYAIFLIYRLKPLQYQQHGI